MLHKNSFSQFVALIGVLLLVLGNPVMSDSQNSKAGTLMKRNATRRTAPAARNIDPARIQYLKGLKGSFPKLVPPSKASGPTTLLIEFQGAPAASVYVNKTKSGASTKTAQAAAVQAIRDNRIQQMGARGAIAGMGGVELFSIQRVLNASVVRVDASKMEQIASLPGVKRVSIAPRHTIENSTSVPFLGTNNLWDTTGVLGALGLTGAGTTIAIIDTGIDYLHYNFRGDADYGNQSNVTSLSDHGFAPSRIVHGVDFVGDNYNAASNSPAQYMMAEHLIFLRI